MRTIRNVRLLALVGALLLTAGLPAHAADPRSNQAQYNQAQYNQAQYNQAQYRQDDPRYYRDDPRAVPQGDPRYSRPDDRGYDRGNGRDDRGYGRPDDRGYGRQERGYGRDDGYRREGDNGGRGGNLPGGTYQASCQGSRMEGSTLVSNCRGRRGERFESALDTSRCGRSDIGNDNGTLQCSGARGNARRVE